VAESLTGWKQQDAQGRPLAEIFQLVDEETRSPVESPVPRVIRAGGAVGLANHTLLIARDGTERPIEDSAAPIRDQGGLLGVVLVFRDASARRRAEAERDQLVWQLQAVAQQMPAGLMVAEAPSGRVLLVNDEARRIMGFDFPPLDPIDSGAEVQAFRGLHPDGTEYRSEDWPLLRAVRFGETVAGEEIELERADGTRVPIRASAAPLRDARGRIVAGVVTFVDISEQRTIERLERDFISMVGHELRNPLASLKGFAQLLQRRQSFDERSVDVIINQADRLERLITDLTDFSRLAAGRLSLDRQPMDLVELVHASAEQARGEFGNHTIRVDAPDVPVVGTWDRDRIGQVLLNLLSNAIKYSPRGGQILVQVEDLGSEARVSVQDPGLGIPPDQLPHLFERFYRAQTPSRNVAGLGLGLYISRELVAAHQGRIWAESHGPNTGSTFRFTLPYATPPAPA
jgi:PAS domain S-box-containing protein